MTISDRFIGAAISAKIGGLVGYNLAHNNDPNLALSVYGFGDIAFIGFAATAAGLDLASAAGRVAARYHLAASLANPNKSPLFSGAEARNAPVIGDQGLGFLPEISLPRMRGPFDNVPLFPRDNISGAYTHHGQPDGMRVDLTRENLATIRKAAGVSPAALVPLC